MAAEDYFDRDHWEEEEYERKYERTLNKQTRKLMLINLIKVDITTVPTAKGSYQKAEVAFKNLSYGGKVEGKSIMSFGATGESFKYLATAPVGEDYEVNVVKNDKGYNDWVSVTKADANVQQASVGSKASATTTPARTSTYETPEERAKKQVYIVRQSSINAAVATLSAGSKSTLKVQEVLSVAKEYETYVFGKYVFGDGDVGFEDVPDFPREAE